MKLVLWLNGGFLLRCETAAAVPQPLSYCFDFSSRCSHPCIIIVIMIISRESMSSGHSVLPYWECQTRLRAAAVVMSVYISRLERLLVAPIHQMALLLLLWAECVEWPDAAVGISRHAWTDVKGARSQTGNGKMACIGVEYGTREHLFAPTEIIKCRAILYI